MKSEANKAKNFRDDGAAFQRWGSLDEAEKCFLKALDCEDSPKDHQTLFRMAELLLEKKDIRLALDYYILAIHADTGNNLYKQRFLDVGGGIRCDHYNADTEYALLECLKAPGIDFSNAGSLWSSTLLKNPDFVRLYTDPRAFEKKLDPAQLLQSYFIEGLKKITIPEPGFEDFIRRLRQWLLMGLSCPHIMPAPADYLRLADAVAAYCFYGNYIIRVTAAEQAKLRDISRQLTNPLVATVYACYGLQDMPAVFEPGSALANILEENGQIKAADDAAGVKEKQPYPRWRSIPAHTLRAELFFPYRKEKMEKTFAGGKAGILVAGCGTGREALVAALYYPRGKITAIDPCRKNIAYADMKSREYNVTNIEFKQSDLQTFGKASKPYDIIYSGDGLNHTKDPLKDWKILWDCLKPAGVMRVSLYSKTARRSMEAVREVVKTLNIGNGRESMLDFRARSADLLPPEVLASVAFTPDYYNMSSYSNLLFHSGERCFTLPEIEEALATLRLSFSGFDVSADVLQHYGSRFPDDPGMISLKNWHQFEQQSPDTFSGMYQFWCRKF